MDEENKFPQEPAPEAAAAPKKPRRPVRHMIWAVCLISLGLMLLGQILGDVLMNLLAGALGVTDGATLFLFMYLSFIGIDLLVLLYCLLCEKPILRSFGRRAEPFGSGNTWRLFGLGLLAGFAMNALYLLAALVCVCVQSGAEELLTRGYMLGALRDRYPLWLAVAVNSLFFGTLHLFNNGITVLSFVNIVAFGLALSFVMVRLESLWFCIAVHTAWNFSQSIFFGLPNSGIVSEGSFLHLEAARDSAVYSALFGVEGAITTTLVLLVLVLCVLLCKRRKQAV